MLKRLMGEPRRESAQPQDWLDLSTATVEISSEDSDHPVECALVGDDERGWRAGECGVQRIRLVFERPQELRRISLSFLEPAVSRTQEFTLRWSQDGKALQEIVRQQWNFSPYGATHETEDYEVRLSGVTVLELTINPDISNSAAYASLQRLRVA